MGEKQQQSDRHYKIIQALQNIVKLQAHPLIDELGGLTSDDTIFGINLGIGSFSERLNRLAMQFGMEWDDRGQWQAPIKTQEESL